MTAPSGAPTSPRWVPRCWSLHWPDGRRRSSIVVVKRPVAALIVATALALVATVAAAAVNADEAPIVNEPPSTTLLEFLGATGAAESVGVDVDRLIDGRLEPRCMSDVHCGTQQEDDESIVDQTEEPEHRP